MFGHQVQLPVDLMYVPTPQENVTFSWYVQNLKPYKVGDLAWLHIPVVKRGEYVSSYFILELALLTLLGT